MKNKFLGVLVVTAIVLLEIGAISGFAMARSWSQEPTEQEKAEMQRENEAIQSAIANRDFMTWRSLMMQSLERMKSDLTQENFNFLVDQYQKNKDQAQNNQGTQQSK